MSPVAFGFQVPERQLGRFPRQNTRHAGRDLARYEFIPATRRFVIEQDAAAGVHPVRLAIIPSQLEASHFADSVSRARVEPRLLILRNFLSLAEPLARPGEVEPALRRQILHRGQEVMCAVDIRIQRRELVVKRIADEALCGEVIAFGGLNLSDDLMYAGITLE